LEQYEDNDGLIVLSKEKADKIKVWDDINYAYEHNTPIEGTIVAKVNKGLSVDIGVRAFLPGSHVDLRPVKNFEKLIGTTAKFKIIKFNKKRGNIVLSRRQILEEEREQQRKETLAKLKEGEIVKGVVKNITEYGVFIDLGGVDGLLHISDITWGRINHPEEQFKVGDEVQVKVLKYDKATEKVSLGIKQMTEDPWLRVHEKYPIGTKVKGKIVSLPDYGIFVEIEPGIEGLVHVSEISWTKKSKNPLKNFNLGDIIEAVVLD
ncbi:MAG: 30S ribosomal protein S1, partial [Myxococcota bacterium]